MEAAIAQSSLPRLRAVLAADPESVRAPLLDRHGFETPLISAIRKHASPEFIELLLTSGADVTATDLHGATALIALADQQQVSIPTTEGLHRDQTGFMGGICLRDPDLLRELLREPSGGGHGGWMFESIELFLNDCRKNQAMEMIQVAMMLLSRGVDPSVKNWQGKTAGDLARANDLHTLAVLVDNYRNAVSCKVLRRAWKRRAGVSSGLVALDSTVMTHIEEFLIDAPVLRHLGRLE